MNVQLIFSWKTKNKADFFASWTIMGRKSIKEARRMEIVRVFLQGGKKRRVGERFHCQDRQGNGCKPQPDHALFSDQGRSCKLPDRLPP